MINLILQTGSSSYCLTSWRKSDLILKLLGQIPKTIHYHGIYTWKGKNDLDINALIHQIG